jgi:hypothetical protein
VLSSAWRSLSTNPTDLPKAYWFDRLPGELTEEQLETMRKDCRQKAENAEALFRTKRKPKARNGNRRPWRLL